MLLTGKRNDFYALIPHGWQQNTNRFLGVLTPALFSFLADFLRLSCSKVLGHLCHFAEVQIVLTIHGAIFRTVRRGVVSRLAADDMTCVCRNDAVSFQVFQSMVQKWIDMGIFR